MNTSVLIQYREDQPLSPLTTLGVGGSCRRLAEVSDCRQLGAALREADANNWPVFYLGEGSNVLFSDDGYKGLVVQNRIRGRERSGNRLILGSGENLKEVIRWTNSEGLAGIERLYGIPGSVGGALVGNAGAYGQEIGSQVAEVEVWLDDRLQTLPARDLGLGYRHTRLKDDRRCFLVSCTLELQPSDRPLQRISDAILTKRLEKYPPELKSPGSFFKNVPVGTLSPTALEAIPDSFIQFGKVPAGRLLEAVGANGTRRGDAAFASYHGNLLMNCGEARGEDLIALAEEFAERVWQRFHVRLEPEIDIVGMDSRP